MVALTPEKGWIFRITHISNVRWLLANGLHCRSSDVQDPNYKQIGNPELIEKRKARTVPVPPGGTLSDYIPFYFTPFSPMLLNIKSGYNGMEQTPMPDIVILVSSIHRLAERSHQFVIADRHAYLAVTHFYSEVSGLQHIDWPLLQARDFRRDPNDPGKFERYQAEALVHKHLPCDALAAIICHSEARRADVSELVAASGLEINVLARPNYFF